MISAAQREVAVHLLANAIRQINVREQSAANHEPAVASRTGVGASARRNSDQAYLRGMYDVLRALYGASSAEDMYRAAQLLERPSPGH